jgi:hypothetical protein
MRVSLINWWGKEKMLIFVPRISHGGEESTARKAGDSEANGCSLAERLPRLKFILKI